jgi:hypothetical protein
MIKAEVPLRGTNIFWDVTGFIVYAISVDLRRRTMGPNRYFERMPMKESQAIAIDDILAAFRTFDGTYQRDMVEAALGRREEIVPRLIAVLEEIIADPVGFLEQEDRFDHIYAFMLLGHFKAVSAHAAIVQVFSLEPKLVDDLFGDHKHDHPPVVLMRTSGGDLRHIRIMVLDRSVHTFCRIAAVRAMAFAVVAGIADRKEVLDFISSLFAGAAEEEDPDFLAFAAISILDLYPGEYMAVIEKAYEDELIFSGLVDLESFQQALAEGKEHALAQHRKELARFDLDDIHAAMSWWACFNENDDWAAAGGPRDIIDSGLYGRPQPNTPKKRDKARKKSKRKQAKTSKRKNRK